jgi:hypothetical protein
MLMTVTNLSTLTLNAPIVGGNGVSADAVGGSRANPLPFPFSHIVLAPTGTTVVVDGKTWADHSDMPVHMEDMRKSIPWLPLEPSREWQMLVQKGLVSVSFAVETGETTAALTSNIEDKGTGKLPL